MKTLAGPGPAGPTVLPSIATAAVRTRSDSREQEAEESVTERTAAAGTVNLERRLDDTRSIILTTGDFTQVIEAWTRHCELWHGESDGLSRVLMRQGLAAAALHLANRPNDELVGWTLNLLQPPTNVFLTGDVRKAIVTGRVYTDGVRTADHSRLFVQTSRASQPEPFQSAIDVTGFDVLEIFEQYYSRSEQNPARFFELDANRFAMVLGLPGVDPLWIQHLEPGSFEGTFAAARAIDGRAFRFECGCSPTKMLRALRSIFENDPDDLFRGEDRVETFCPRCGRRWWVTREQFLAPADGSLG
jgi:molecular chaperone Hsp33